MKRVRTSDIWYRAAVRRNAPFGEQAIAWMRGQLPLPEVGRLVAPGLLTYTPTTEPTTERRSGV